MQHRINFHNKTAFVFTRMPFLFFLSIPSSSHRIPFIQPNELRAVVFEKQIDLAGGAVAVFCDDQLRQVNGGGARVFVIVFPVQEHDDVRVLLQRAGFPQVAEQGLLALAQFYAAA